MSNKIQPIYAIPGNDYKHLSEWTPASPWPDAEVAFHWANFAYPYPHIHDYWEILVLVSGTLNHEINGNTVVLKQHHACLLRPDDCHNTSEIGDTPIILLNMMAKKEYVERILSIYGDDMKERLLTKEDLSFTVSEATFNKCITDTQALQADSTLSLDEKISRCKVLFAGLVSELMMQNVSSDDTQPKWLSDFLIKLSQSDLSNVSIKDDLIADSSYSYSRLIYLFKKHMGCTISQYITQLRVERAKEYLKRSNMHIIDIAAAVGCDNVTHFNRIFKKATGVSPSEFRKKNTSNASILVAAKEDRKEGKKEGKKEGRKEGRKEGKKERTKKVKPSSSNAK